MRINFSVQTPQVNGQKRVANEVAKKVLFRSMVKMEEIAKAKAPVDTGNLKNRIHLSPTKEGSRTYTLSDGVDYGIHVEYGTKPHFIPIIPLKGWAKRVLGDPNLAYAVRANIAKRGIPAQPFFRPAYEEVRLKWVKIIRKQVLSEFYG